MIKRYFISTLIIFMILAFSLTGSYAQASDSKTYSFKEDESKSFSFHWYPIGAFFIDYYSFDAGLTLSSYLTLNVEFQYWDISGFIGDFTKLFGFGEGLSDWDIYLLKFGPGLRVYPEGKAPEGIFAGAYFNYEVFNCTYKPYNQTGKADIASITLWFGIQEILSEIISFEVATGWKFYPSVSHVEVTGPWGIQICDPDESGILLDWAGMAVGLGVAF